MFDKNLPILHSQYHGCWCPGGARSQGISDHDINNKLETDIMNILAVRWIPGDLISDKLTLVLVIAWWSVSIVKGWLPVDPSIQDEEY